MFLDSLVHTYIDLIVEVECGVWSEAAFVCSVSSADPFTNSEVAVKNSLAGKAR